MECRTAWRQQQQQTAATAAVAGTAAQPVDQSSCGGGGGDGGTWPVVEGADNYTWTAVRANVRSAESVRLDAAGVLMTRARATQNNNNNKTRYDV